MCASAPGYDVADLARSEATTEQRRSVDEQAGAYTVPEHDQHEITESGRGSNNVPSTLEQRAG